MLANEHSFTEWLLTTQSVIRHCHVFVSCRGRARGLAFGIMAIEITTVEVFERALVLSVDERTQLAMQLLRSLDNNSDQEPSSAEQIRARFRALDARFVVACRGEIERSEGQEEVFVPRLA